MTTRRKFFGTLFGLAIAPAVAVKVLSAPPALKYKVYGSTTDGDMLVGYKGTEFMRAGVINAPYIPIANGFSKKQSVSFFLQTRRRCKENILIYAT
jgi:hypothetical protein